MHCLQCSYSNISSAKHQKDCIVINGVQAIELPEPYIEKMDKKEFQASILKIIKNNYHFLL